jgi:hypothetical protein
MDLCRELGIVRAREGGGRRSENAPLRNEQFNFDFGFWTIPLWALEKLGESALKEVPEKKLEETYTRLNTSLHMVRAELGRRPLHRLADPIRRWFWGTLSASGVSCFYYLADGDKLEAARGDKAIQRVFPPFPAPSMAEATARLERMAPSRPISPQSQISNLKSEIPEEVDGARVETPQPPERDSLPLWCGFQNRSRLDRRFSKGYLPSFDTSWHECDPSSAFHAEDEAAALIIAREKIFARLPENTPVDNSKKGAGPQGDRA